MVESPNPWLNPNTIFSVALGFFTFFFFTESRARKKKNWEDDDFYDSDDDTFLDRTGTVEKKREKRMKKYGKDEKKVETYESLVC